MAQHGLSLVVLDRYGKRCCKLEHPPAQRQPEPNRIIPVELINSAASACSSAGQRSRAMWVESANDRRIEIAHGFDGSTLELNDQF